MNQNTEKIQVNSVCFIIYKIFCILHPIRANTEKCQASQNLFIVKKYHFTKLIFTKYTGCLFTYYTLSTAFSVLVIKSVFMRKKLLQHFIQR